MRCLSDRIVGGWVSAPHAEGAVLHDPSPPAYERAVRDQRLRTETAQAKRENAYYLQNVEKGMEISAIVERKRKRGTAREVRVHGSWLEVCFTAAVPPSAVWGVEEGV